MQIICATKNKGKVDEIKAIMRGMSLEIKAMSECGIDLDIVEDGTTYEENAWKKCEALRSFRPGGDFAVLADDSGIEIDFLDKRPGVYSARFLGEDTPYDIKNRRILEMLADIPPEQRTARFVCVIAVILPDGTRFMSRGVVEGRVAYEINGEGGFGYDPIFFLPEFDKTMAELSSEEKNQISHRAKALIAARDSLADIGA